MNQQAVEIKLEKEAFENWLKGKNKTAYAGDRVSADCCPIANWLQEINNLSDIEVYCKEIYIDSYRIPAPQWIHYFILEVEKTSRQGSFRVCKVEEALQILSTLDTNAKKD